ncbi:MAG: hypothetical protein PWQ40_1907 [Archaeoglobus sp.]|uniref:Uncharacterized protein n=2 Tax=Archaeoglobus fulgidus TaxID=2234 RepID=A0A075WFP7_ARCFL|nr:hypothetical protein AFULGI_00024840 [Archaeoglobus fulgidus DSM 8774]KUJ93614.1 MAG: hypothetical protein XD40_1165 [Archaeoglobus fulgidus]KUK07325.1 MAG: hypothetical protein XD48_0412 [Archaeoglobus fulgidus]MDI3498538.1 hypothetical protein [Archaeoglobus sp.]
MYSVKDIVKELKVFEMYLSKLKGISTYIQKKTLITGFQRL